MDLTQLADTELADHLNDVISEQERRQRVAQAPTQIHYLATRYLEDGGDPAKLTLPDGAHA